jgi:hypothetical protein
MNLASNMVLVGRDIWDTGPHMQSRYKSLDNHDLTADPIVVGRILGDDLSGYLNQYFDGWRLLRLVEEKRRHPEAPPYKEVCYVVALGTDADAETLTGRLRKGDYPIPGLAGITL